MLNVSIARCPNCKSKCQKIVENSLRTPSRCVLTEANKYTRKAAKDELDEKVRVWGNAAPPMNLDAPVDETDFDTMMKYKFVKNGSFYLTEELEYINIKANGEDESSNASSNDDGDY